MSVIKLNWEKATDGKAGWIAFVSELNAKCLMNSLQDYKDGSWNIPPLGPAPMDPAAVDPNPAANYVNRVTIAYKQFEHYEKKSLVNKKAHGSLIGLVHGMFKEGCVAAMSIDSVINDATILLEDKFPAIWAILQEKFQPQNELESVDLHGEFQKLNDEHMSFSEFDKELNKYRNKLIQLNMPLTDIELNSRVMKGITNPHLASIITARIAAVTDEAPFQWEQTMVALRKIIQVHSEWDNPKTTRNSAAKVKDANSEKAPKKAADAKVVKKDASSNDSTKPVPPCGRCGREGHFTRDCHAKFCVRCKENIGSEQHSCQMRGAPVTRSVQGAAKEGNKGKPSAGSFSKAEAEKAKLWGYEKQRDEATSRPYAVKKGRESESRVVIREPRDESPRRRRRSPSPSPPRKRSAKRSKRSGYESESD